MALFAFGSARAQADALFSYVTTPEITLYEWRTVMDNTGYVWLVGGFPKREVYCTRIAPNGRKVLELIPFPERHILGHNLVTDRWDNLYYVYSTNGPLNLIRLSVNGEVQNYVLAENAGVVSFEAYLEILPGDTLIVIDRYSLSAEHIVKALITKDGVKPIFEDISSKGNSLLYFLGGCNYRVPIPEWNEGRGLVAGLIGDTTIEDLLILRLNLTPEKNWGEEEVGSFPWRDYIWRSYPDVWTGRMTYARHRDGGYVLCIPDPIDSSRTHLLRIDDSGVLLDPSSLSGSGTYLSRSFTRLPESAKPYVELKVWQKLRDGCPTFEPDSALVVFWGLDDLGNLYAYRKFKRY